MIIFNVLNITDLDLSKNIKKIKNIIDGKKNNQSEYDIFFGRDISIEITNKVLSSMIYFLNIIQNKIKLIFTIFKLKVKYYSMN